VESLAAFDQFRLDEFQVLELLIDDGLTLSLGFIHFFLHLDQFLGGVYQ